jgi:long-subunit acyl-CoA synthetase (AMP-forming)
MLCQPEFVEEVNRACPRIPRVKNYVSIQRDTQGMVSHRELLMAHSKEEPDIQVEKEDPFLIFYTSGTTGLPRGAIYTHDRNLDNTVTKVLQIGCEEGDKHIMILPLFHLVGIVTSAAQGGVTHHPQRTFDPAAILGPEEKATDLHIVPTQLVSMLAFRCECV